MSEITGLSGQRSLDAILAGERDPIKLAELCHARVKSSQDILARALEGHTDLNICSTQSTAGL